MKIRDWSSTGLIVAAVAAAGVLVTACAGTSSSTTTKSLLTASGFRVRTPQTPKQKELYAALPANKVERATVNGKTFYVLKDEAAGVAYVGGEPEYQRYKQLCEQKHAEPTLYMSENMNSIQSHRWYGEWGAQVVWR